MKSTFEMTRAELRASQALWPESLSDDELVRDLVFLHSRDDVVTAKYADGTRSYGMPYSLRMLEREMRERKLDISFQKE